MASSSRSVNSVPWSTIVYKIILIAVVLISLWGSSYAWDAPDLELFDLVESVQENFYDVLEIYQSASQSDIRRAYRRLSLQLHPDKNKQDGAEEKFRKLVAVSEILRDEERRNRYDGILEHGLPDWRQPVFYYRRVRKMGLMELSIVLSGIFTVGHYLVLWSMYFERKLELEALVKPKREKKNKKANKQASNQCNSELPGLSLLHDPTFIQKPVLSDLLPWKVGCLTVTTMQRLPEVYRSMIENWKARRRTKEEEEKEPKEEILEKETGGSRAKQRLDPAMYDYDRSAYAAVTMTVCEGIDNVNCDITSSQIDSRDKTQVQNTEWSSFEISSLVKCMTKYPGGTTDRWVKIAAELHKPVDSVTKKAKQLKTQRFGTGIAVTSQGITGGVQHAVTSKKSGCAITDDSITSSSNQEDWEESPHKEHSMVSSGIKRYQLAKPAKSSERTLMRADQVQEEKDNDTKERSDRYTNNHTALNRDELVHPGVESCMWTQHQQKILEKAMQDFPRGSGNRWDKIADSVPGKTKEDCITRYKELVEVIKRKKSTVQR